ncbi:hypothetical protein QBC47DRAFT_112326 [Echria macrotheca]|uniref:Uncharacterized protein n=1 Tax=Echria macrotheca TaxID=438768 RepID=A0AAJ0BJW7_9PEZI|nr:hypothetical protein QBC47DRAFT_112326 [Echria macrotheca]
MDPDPLRHLEFFSVPNNQTINPVDQSFSLGGTPSTQSPIWDTAAALGISPGLSGSSTVPTSLSLDPMAPSTPASGLATMSGLPPLSRPSFGGAPRPTIPMKAPRSRDGHEKKRSRLSTDATPLDSVDYWIQFDNEDSLADIPEGVEVSNANMRARGRPSQTTQR